MLKLNLTQIALVIKNTQDRQSFFCVSLPDSTIFPRNDYRQNEYYSAAIQ